MKFNYYIMLGALLISAPFKAQEQTKDSTLLRTVVVEQEYNPTVMDAAKLNVVPPIEEPQVTKKEVIYDSTFSPSYTFPQASIEPYMGKEVFKKGYPGYFRLGYGNLGNVDSRINYLFNISDKDKLNIDFSLMGMNGKLDVGDKPKWNAHYYQTRAGINYQHQFAGANLKLGGSFGLSNFNYITEGKQKFSSGSFSAGVETTNKELPVQADVNFKFSHYNRQTDFIIYKQIKDNKENKLFTTANVFAPINDESKVGVAFAMNNFIYDNEDIKNYTTTDFNPYYEYNDDNWKLRLGANVDLSFGFGKSINVSPDVNIGYVFSDSYQFYAKATGGRQVNDFRQLEILNPYAIIHNRMENRPIDPITGFPTFVIHNRMEDSYEQLNASVGFKASPTAGLWLNLFGGYQNIKKDLIQYNKWSIEGYNFDVDLGVTNTDNVYVGATFSYAYKNLVDLTLNGIYRKWSADNDWALLMKPMFDLDFRTVVRPISPLDIELGYRYIHRADSKQVDRLDAVNNLHLEVTYRLYKGASIYIKADNLLNQKYQYFYNIPTAGINFVGGVKLLF